MTIKKELTRIAYILIWLLTLLAMIFTFPIWLPIKMIFYPTEDSGIY